jgi:hypothetical protein
MGRHLDSTLRFSGTSDVVTIGAASTQSAAFGANTHEVRLCAAAATEGCWVNIGQDPTASAGDGSFFLPVNQPEYFHVSPGQKVAVIQVTTGGSLSVAEMTR